MRAYRDALKLLFLFLARQKHKPVADKPKPLTISNPTPCWPFWIISNRNAGTAPLHGIADSPPSAVLTSCGKM
jgi:hypothetical protein